MVQLLKLHRDDGWLAMAHSCRRRRGRRENGCFAESGEDLFAKVSTWTTK